MSIVAEHITALQTGFPKLKLNTKYNYELRRKMLRSTWFPANQKELDRCAHASARNSH